MFQSQALPYHSGHHNQFSTSPTNAFLSSKIVDLKQENPSSIIVTWVSSARKLGICNRRDMLCDEVSFMQNAHGSLPFKGIHYRKRVGCNAFLAGRKTDSSVSMPSVVCMNVSSPGNDWKELCKTKIVTGVSQGQKVEDTDSMVKVMGLGSSTLSILKFCLQSGLLPYAKFWIKTSGSTTFHILQTVQCIDSSGVSQGEASPLLTFLVLGSGSNVDLNIASQIVNTTKSTDTLFVGIIIKPFTFEGARRLGKVEEMIDSLHASTDLLLVLESDAFLRNDNVTLVDACNLANNAGLLAMKSLSELLLTCRGTVCSSVKDGIMEINPSEIVLLLQQSGRAKMGFAVGPTIKGAIEDVILNSPVLKDFALSAKGLVICTVTSKYGLAVEDVHAAMQILHRMMNVEVKIVCNQVIDPTLVNGANLVTLIIVGNKVDMTKLDCADEKSLQKNLEAKHSFECLDVEKENHFNFGNVNDSTVAECIGNEKMLATMGNDSNIVNESAEIGDNDNRMTKFNLIQRLPVTNKRLSNTHMKTLEKLAATSQSYSDPIDLGPCSAAATAWAQARAQARKQIGMSGGYEDLVLSFGVRKTTEMPHNRKPSLINPQCQSFPQPLPLDPAAVPPQIRVLDFGIGAVMDICQAASALVSGKTDGDELKKSSLSRRAASMLEYERSDKEATPVIEMKLHGGDFRGHCQQGLPHGKGRCTYPDGSFYDGQWDQGRRSGTGSLYYETGDMYQGSWKDDLMHGKGWLYFHSRDRLFATFVSGKANGEGRYYSADGHVFFGQFKDNWRHGECLYIESSGKRWREIWDYGMLISRRLIEDSEDKSAAEIFG